MSIKKFSMMLLSAMSLALLLNGCGSSSKESAISAGAVARVGDTACFQCHSSTADPLTGETFITQYQRSLHASLGCESCHGGGSQHNGIGPFPYELNSKLSDAQKAQRCAMCHNGTDAPLSSSANFQNGNHANPFGAEEAHEAKCARCHSHEGAILYGKEGFTGSQDIINDPALQPVLARDPETFNTIKCATCHEHGGNLRQTKTWNAAKTAVVTWDPNNNKVTDQYDLCTSCHTMEVINPNNAAKTRLIGSGNILAIAKAGGGFTNVTTAAYYHNTRWFRTLPSTHVDQAASGTGASGTVIEGYVVRKSTKNPCYDCHGHEFKANTRALVDHPERPATTFTDWAQSAHAGKLLTQKLAAASANAPAAGLTGAALTTAQKNQVDAVMKAGVTEASGAAWSHYNWDATFKADGTSDRGACQRCHTSTGASNFMKNPAGYDFANNSFTHLEGWKAGTAKLGVAGTATTSSGQNELLYCWGCHSNAGAGKLYAPGARVETYDVATAGDTPVTISYPDVAGSNVCLTCHVGREVGDTIKNDNDADGVRGFVNSHYLTAGGQLFGKSGYTFAGKDYTNPAFFAHDKIGTAAAPGTGSNGPCVGCHMTSPNKHKFTNVSTSGGVITGITSNACVTCHTGGFALTAAKLVTEEEEYQAALAGLKAALASKGIFFANSNPYFFKDTNANGVLDPSEIDRNNAFTNWAGVYGVALWKDTMGAAFNANMLAHDPGGYAHNRFYAKRLIWDSIDFIDDGILNNSVPATLAARLTGQTLTDAQAYLGATRP